MFQSNRSKSTSNLHEPLLAEGASSTRLIVIVGADFLFVEEASRLELDDGLAGEGEGFYRSTSDQITTSKSGSMDILLDQLLEAIDASLSPRQVLPVGAAFWGSSSEFWLSKDYCLSMAAKDPVETECRQVTWWSVRRSVAFLPVL